MPGTYRAAGMAKALTGWTGAITVTVGGTASTVAIAEPASAIEVALQIDQTLMALGATALGVSVSDAGVLQWSALSSFTLAATLNSATRLNIPASTTGQTVTGSGAHADGFYPSGGLMIRDPFIASSTATSVANSIGNTGVQPMSKSITLEAHADLSEIWTLEDDFSDDQLWDLWTGGRFRGRLRVLRVNRERLGKSAELARLTLDAETQQDRGPY